MKICLFIILFVISTCLIAQLNIPQKQIIEPNNPKLAKAHLLPLESKNAIKVGVPAEASYKMLMALSISIYACTTVTDIHVSGKDEYTVNCDRYLHQFTVNILNVRDDGIAGIMIR